MLSLIVCSRGRPKQFALLNECYIRQTVKPDEWLLVGEDLLRYEGSSDIKAIQRDNRRDEKHIAIT